MWMRPECYSVGEDNFLESALSCHYLGPCVLTQVIIQRWAEDEHLYPWAISSVLYVYIFCRGSMRNWISDLVCYLSLSYHWTASPHCICNCVGCLYIHYIYFTGFYSLSNMSLFYHTLVLLEIVFLSSLIQENAISVWFKFGLLLVWIIFQVLNCHLNFHFDEPFLIILCSIFC